MLNSQQQQDSKANRRVHPLPLLLFPLDSQGCSSRAQGLVCLSCQYGYQ